MPLQTRNTYLHVRVNCRFVINPTLKTFDEPGQFGKNLNLKSFVFKKYMFKGEIVEMNAEI
jgi:hypothetical protein